MKKIILTFVLAIAFTASYGQQKWQMKKINYFVDEAAKEFKLDKKAKKKLLTVRTAYFKEYIDSMKKIKADGIEGDEKRKILNGVNQKFNKKLREISGKERAGIQPFLQRMRKELKNVK